MWYKRFAMTSPQSGPVQSSLLRAIGRWSLAALAVNSVIGSGIFGLPATVAGLLGKRSVVAVLIAGAAMGVIMACFAEVASQFSEAGGPYLYARTAFGRIFCPRISTQPSEGLASASIMRIVVVLPAPFLPRKA